MPLRRYLASAALIAATPAGAQVLPPITLLDVDANVTLVAERVTVLETKVNAQTAINANVDAKLDANVAAVARVDAKADVNAKAIVDVNARVDGNIAAIAKVDAKADVNAAAIVKLDAQVLANADATVTLAGRIDGHDRAIGDLAGRVVQNTTNIANNTVAIANVDNRVTAIDQRVTNNTAAITNIDQRVTNNTTAIANVDARVTANDRRDDAQDVVLASHDQRITRAQSTADTARVETATLRSDVDAGRAGLVRQAGPTAEVTVASYTGGTTVNFAGTEGDRRLTGVASGVAANDAANMGQVRTAAADTLAAANDYTDRSVETMMQRQTDAFQRMVVSNNAVLKRDIDSSAAGTAALASLPQAIVPGAGLAGVSLGGKGEQVALAMGVSKAFAGRHVPILRAGASVDTRTGDATYNIGAGLHF